MIRPAKFADVPRIVELLCEAHAKSRYAAVTPVNEQAAHRLVAGCVQRHGHTTVGGSLVMVWEIDGEVTGMIIGVIDRIYHIGEKLSANDLYLYSQGGQSLPAIMLFNAYMDWALGNPNVAEVHASWTDALPDAERVITIYKRCGFERCGEIWKRGPR